MALLRASPLAVIARFSAASLTWMLARLGQAYNEPYLRLNTASQFISIGGAVGISIFSFLFFLSIRSDLCTHIRSGEN